MKTLIVTILALFSINTFTTLAKAAESKDEYCIASYDADDIASIAGRIDIYVKCGASGQQKYQFTQWGCYFNIHSCEDRFIADTKAALAKQDIHFLLEQKQGDRLFVFKKGSTNSISRNSVVLMTRLALKDIATKKYVEYLSIYANSNLTELDRTSIKGFNDYSKTLSAMKQSNMRFLGKVMVSELFTGRQEYLILQE